MIVWRKSDFAPAMHTGHTFRAKRSTGPRVGPTQVDVDIVVSFMYTAERSMTHLCSYYACDIKC